MLSKQRPGSVETTEGCRSPDGSTREKNLNTYGLRMEYLWSTYGIPMEQHHHNTVATPRPHRSKASPVRGAQAAGTQVGTAGFRGKRFRLTVIRARVRLPLPASPVCPNLPRAHTKPAQRAPLTGCPA